MPEPSFEGESINRDHAMEINYYTVDSGETLKTDFSKLTEELLLIFNRVCHSVDNALGEMLFVDATGGTGKTFLSEIFLAKLR